METLGTLVAKKASSATYKVSVLVLTASGQGMNILCIKGTARSLVNGFRERISAIINASYAVGCLN